MVITGILSLGFTQFYYKTIGPFQPKGEFDRAAE
jgi:hypothetical protein